MSESDKTLYTVELWDLDENDNPILYCFEEDEKDEIESTHAVPGTLHTPGEIGLDVYSIIPVREDFDKQKCKTIDDYKSNQAVYRDTEGYQAFNETGFCVKDTKCKINGILMCIGIVVLHENDDRILCHYVTGDDHLSCEKHKLQEIKNEMTKRNWKWDNSTLQLYYRLYSPGELKNQNTSISIIANTLNISIGNIVLNIITDNYIKFN
jgi:hypothetical protein